MDAKRGLLVMKTELGTRGMIMASHIRNFLERIRMFLDGAHRSNDDRSPKKQTEPGQSEGKACSSPGDTTEMIRKLKAHLRFQRRAATVFEKRITQLEQQLADLSACVSIDPLTGLLNRQGAIDQFIATTSAVWRVTTGHMLNKRLPCSVVLIDLANFKRNDGEPDILVRQDEARKAVSHMMRKSFPRKSDILARISENEFIAIMPHANHGVAERRLDTLLQRMFFEPMITGAVNVNESNAGIASIIISPTANGLKADAVLISLEQAIDEARLTIRLSQER